MDQTLAISLSNQLALRRKLDVIANNVANMSTTGFKREIPLFEDVPVVARSYDVTGDSRRISLNFVRDYGLMRDLAGGELVTTGSPLDLGIEGDGFFVIGTPDGERYTRNGNFRLDDTGRIVNAEGNPLLSDGGGELVVSPEDLPLLVAEDGTLSTRAGIVGRVALVRFDQPGALEKVGASLYAAEETPVPADGGRIMQGMIERSNVQPVMEMTTMIDVMRAYQHSTELVQAGEEMERRAIQRLGDTRV